MMRSMNIVLATYSIIICSILLLYLVSGGRIHKHLNQYFAIMCSANIVMMLGDILYWNFEAQPSVWNPFMVWLGSYMFYLGVIPITFAFTKYMIAYVCLNKKESRSLQRIVQVLTILYFCGCFINLGNGMFFHIDDNFVYRRGTFFLVSQIIPFLIFILDIIFVYKNRCNIRRKDHVFFLSYIILIVVAQCVQYRVVGLTLLNTAMSISLLLVFINIQLECDIGMEKKERELEDAEISILLSQIEPHFLYNTLTAIHHLCDKDMEEAKTTITNFSRFLRGNMSILTSKEKITFEKELEHTKYYLEIEKKRFGDRLQIHYDIGVVDFLLPPLSLQPMVENAVRYGITKKVEGGNLFIQTLQREGFYIIRVVDDGMGFSMLPFDNVKETHIGIDNVRKRIEYMCNGTLQITSKKNEGTVVEIRIPMKL